MNVSDGGWDEGVYVYVYALSPLDDIQDPTQKSNPKVLCLIVALVGVDGEVVGTCGEVNRKKAACGVPKVAALGTLE